jgi:hypothetical protein
MLMVAGGSPVYMRCKERIGAGFGMELNTCTRNLFRVCRADFRFCFGGQVWWPAGRFNSGAFLSGER